MRDWSKELPPGTLLFAKIEKVFALVIHVKCTQLPNWRNLEVMVLMSNGELKTSTQEAGYFYQSWLKVRT